MILLQGINNTIITFLTVTEKKVNQSLEWINQEKEKINILITINIKSISKIYYTSY